MPIRRVFEVIALFFCTSSSPFAFAGRVYSLGGEYSFLSSKVLSSLPETAGDSATIYSSFQGKLHLGHDLGLGADQIFKWSTGLDVVLTQFQPAPSFEIVGGNQLTYQLDTGLSLELGFLSLGIVGGYRRTILPAISPSEMQVGVSSVGSFVAGGVVNLQFFSSDRALFRDRKSVV